MAFAAIPITGISYGPPVSPLSTLWLHVEYGWQAAFVLGGQWLQSQDTAPTSINWDITVVEYAEGTWT
jgi:hypothetical protein